VDGAGNFKEWLLQVSLFPILSLVSLVRTELNVDKRDKVCHGKLRAGKIDGSELNYRALGLPCKIDMSKWSDLSDGVTVKQKRS
jgi:hypothetical protein